MTKEAKRKAIRDFTANPSKYSVKSKPRNTFLGLPLWLEVISIGCFIAFWIMLTYKIVAATIPLL